MSWTELKTNNRILQQLLVKKELLNKVRFLERTWPLRTHDMKMQLSGKGYIARLREI